MTWEVVRAEGRLELVGELRTSAASEVWRTLRDASHDPGAQLDLDLARTVAIDKVVVVLLVELRGILGSHGTHCELVHIPAEILPIVRLYGGDAPVAPARPVPARPGAISRLGDGIAALGERFREPIRFAGELIIATLHTIRKPRLGNWRTLPSLIQHAGSEAIPIVIVLLFLVGFTIAVQATPSLQMLGANIYVVDLVGVSVTRELAPLMTAIILSGRSGAAFAAELGTMRISDEVDALRTMGIDPLPYLALPRMVALVIVAPMLTMIGELAAVLGGLVISAVSLDITPQAYLAELRTTIFPSDVWTGLIKTVLFAIAIGFVGCQEGFATSNAAVGVGRRTTATVVVCLFAVVVIDAVMTIFFRRLEV